MRCFLKNFALLSDLLFETAVQVAILADAVEEAVFVVAVGAQVGVGGYDDLDVLLMRTGH